MEEITIGSDLSCTICVNKTTVAAKHCTIETDEKGHFTVTNHEPDFETWVNGEKVENKSSFEKIDTVKVGDITLSWNDIQLDQKYDEKTKNVIQKKRNGFVTFWLYLGIFANGYAIYRLFHEYKEALPNENMINNSTQVGFDINPIINKLHIMLYIGIIGSLLGVFFLSRILNWRKYGFWGYICTAIIMDLISFILYQSLLLDFSTIVDLDAMGNDTIGFLTNLVSIVILWAVLQIRKDGVSCWKQLE